MRPLHLILLLGLNVGWATVPTLATRLEGRLGPLEFVFLRYAFALIGLLALWPWLPGKLPRGQDFWRTAVMGIAVFNLGHLLQISGFQLSKAGDASLLLAFDPLICSLGAAIFLRERIPPRRWLGFACAMLGMALMSLWQPTSALPGLLANLFIILSFVTESIWSVMGKPLVQRWGIPKVTALALLAGTTVNFLFLLPHAPAHLQAFAALPAIDWWTLALLGVIFTAFGYSVWYIVIRETPISLAAMTIYLQPLVGTALAAGFTQDALHLGHLLGGTAILGGLAIGLSRPKR